MAYKDKEKKRATGRAWYAAIAINACSILGVLRALKVMADEASQQ